MADDEGPRRLPPQPSALQVSIPQPVVPEVTLLWEGEDSIYWKPNTPGSKSAQHPADHTKLPLLVPHSHSTATIANRPQFAASINQRPPPVQATATVVQANSRNNQQPEAFNDIGANQQHLVTAPQTLEHQMPIQVQQPVRSCLPVTSRPMGIYSTAGQENVHVSNAVSSSYNCSVNSAVGGTGFSVGNTSKRDNDPNSIACGVLFGKNSNPTVLHSLESDKKMDCMNGATGPRLPERLGNQIYNPERCKAPPIQQSSLQAENQQMHAHDLHFQNSKFKETTEKTAVYNPLLYSSEKKPLQERNIYCYKVSDSTPVAARAGPRTIVPRAVDFDASPVESQNSWRSNQENCTPEYRYNYSKNSTAQQGRNNEYEIIPYRGRTELSPMAVNSPDPFLQKIIEGKDQQIFQLHKVLETILSKNETRDRIYSQNSSVSLSPKSLVYREISTQTECSFEKGRQYCDVATNTDIELSDMLQLLHNSQYLKREDHLRGEDRPSTILKNSTSAKSMLMHKSSNISSVRFDTDTDRIRDNARTVTTTKTHQVNVLQEQAINRNELKNDVRLQQASEKGNSSPKYTHSNSKTDSECPERGAPRARNNGNSCAYNGNNHREVSLTLREVVLTTIEEDPGSPQESLHLDLSDYPGDTILPPAHNNPELRRPGGARAAWDCRPEGKIAMTARRAEQIVNAVTPHKFAGAPNRGCYNGPDAPLRRDHAALKSASPAAECRDTSDAPQCGKPKTGVTIYRNVMNNIEQLLGNEPAPQVDHARQQDHRALEAARDTQVLSLEQQLQHFGLSFLEPRHQNRSSPAGHRSSGPTGVGSLLSLYRANAVGSLPSDDACTAAPREFSVATEEFLRRNGLLQS
ncbi:uncharacterized protein LOC108667647 [Hyalella azteca]|uniref:Uncharacterized protein LOC108667647 n=1 Tax=Hyalella azteca TaxID=294128 RepID=A0A8B7N8L1_HYAAZ|nr:uncharacterized protein LOC108667647 [Hyalella azteca]XP_047737074.1 uncharacterized protein LOC108667647 [Hyalella azteca]